MVIVKVIVISFKLRLGEHGRLVVTAESTAARSPGGSTSATSLVASAESARSIGPTAKSSTAAVIAVVEVSSVVAVTKTAAVPSTESASVPTVTRVLAALRPSVIRAWVNGTHTIVIWHQLAVDANVARLIALVLSPSSLVPPRGSVVASSSSISTSAVVLVHRLVRHGLLVTEVVK